MPEVSVLIPARNATATIEETLRSVLNQTVANFEVLVVDDGSQDRTAEVAAATGDPRVRVIRIEQSGVSAARNRAIAEARSELIAFIDADDLWSADKLERQLEVMRAQPEVGLCVTGGVRIDAGSNVIAAIPLFETSRDYTRDLLLHSSIAGLICSGVVRRELLDRVGGFATTLQYCEDWHLWLRLSVATSLSVIPDPLVQIRVHPGNTSGDPQLLERDTFAALASFFSMPEAAAYLDMRAHAYGAQWMVCAGSYLHTGRIASACRCLWRSVAAYPRGATYALALPARWTRRWRRAVSGARAS